jgi:AbrB family looped-hinge helix DNA binding protein
MELSLPDLSPLKKQKVSFCSNPRGTPLAFFEKKDISCIFYLARISLPCYSSSMKKIRDVSDGNQFIGWVTVSSKGQVAVPTEIRNGLGIKDGDRLLIVLRREKDGFNLIKSKALNEVFERFGKQEGGDRI